MTAHFLQYTPYTSYIDVTHKWTFQLDPRVMWIWIVTRCHTTTLSISAVICLYIQDSMY